MGNPLSCRTIERMDAMMEAKRSVGKPNIQTSNRTMLSHQNKLLDKASKVMMMNAFFYAQPEGRKSLGRSVDLVRDGQRKNGIGEEKWSALPFKEIANN